MRIVTVKLKHSVSLTEAKKIFDQSYIVDQKNDNPEQFPAIGWCRGRLCSVIFEVRHDSRGEYYHLITALIAPLGLPACSVLCGLNLIVISDEVIENGIKPMADNRGISELAIIKAGSVLPVVLLLLAGFGLTSAMGQSNRPAPIFRHAVEQIQSETQIPILLPSKLPPAFPEKHLKLATVEMSTDGYYIHVYFTEIEAGVGGDWAGGFGASTEPVDDLPSTRRVQLAGGRTGIFRPISCGGSCAPANLWWEQNGFTYQIQLKLRSDLPEKDQEKILVVTANSSITVQRPIRTH